MDEQLGFSSSGKGALLPKPMADARTLPKRTNRRTMIRQDSIKRRPNKKAESESSASVSSSNSEPPENESQTEAQHRENMALFDQIVADSEEDEPELKAINRPTLRKASSMRSLSSSPETLETETSTLDSSSPKPYDPRPVQPLDKRPTLRRRESRRKREKIRRHNSLNDLVRQESLRGLDNRESPPEKTTPMYKSSHPISLLELMRRTSEIKFSNKSCLKKKNKDRPSSPKTVKFATNSYNDKVWITIKQVRRLRRKSRLAGILWWTDREINDIRAELVDLADATAPSYGEQLRHAYEACSEHSSSTISGDPIVLLETKPLPSSSTTTQDRALPCYEDDDYELELQLEDIARFAAARGLEAVVNPVLEDFKEVHRNAVLNTQRIVRKNGAKKVLDNFDWEMIRGQSLENSRPCRLLAAKLAEFDRRQAKQALKARNDAAPRVPGRSSSRGRGGQ